MNATTTMFHDLSVAALAILSLMLGQGIANGQVSPGESVSSGTDNVIPQRCCDHLELIVQQQATQPESSQDATRQTITGLTEVHVRISNSGASAVSCRLTVESDMGQGVAYDENNISVPADGSVERLINIKSDDMRICQTWAARLYCTGYPDYCDEKTITTGKCSECTSCDGSTAEPSAVQESDLVFTQPMLSFNGGMSGGVMKFRLNAADPTGLAEAIPNVAGDAVVTRNTKGAVVRVQCGTASMDLAEDAAGQAFWISLKDQAGTEFRTTRISRINEDGKDRLRMDSTYQGVTRRWEQTQEGPACTVLEKGVMAGVDFVSLWRERLTKATESPGVVSYRREIWQRASGSHPWAVTSDIQTTWEDQVFGWVRTREVIDPEGAALTTVWSYYQPGESTGPGASRKGIGRLKRIVRYDGHEALYTYGQSAQSVITPYAGDVAGQVTTTTWDPATRSETVIATVCGQIISKVVTSHTPTTSTQTIYAAAGSVLTTVTTYRPSGQDFGGNPVRIQHSDGTLTTYAYTRHAGGGYTTITENGATANGSTVSQGTRTTTTTNASGTTILSKSEAIGYGTGSALFDCSAVTEVDHLGRALTTAHYPTAASVSGEQAVAVGAAWTTSTQYSCCGIASETDMHGITTFHAYDGLQRHVKSNRLGVTTESIRRTGLDEQGKPLVITETHRYPQTVEVSLSSELHGSAENLISRTVSNLSGTLEESWTPDPIHHANGALVKDSSTVTTYKPAGGLSIRTVTTRADGNSQTTDHYLDGRTYRSYGALSPGMELGYSVNTTGEAFVRSYLDADQLKHETVTVQNDWAGRTLSTTYMDGAVATMTYNPLGQMVASREPGADGVITLMAYNAKGEHVITAVDLNRNGVIDYGVDTVSSIEESPALEGGVPILQSISKVWQPGDTRPDGGTVVAMSKGSPDGLASQSQTIGVANPLTTRTHLGGNGNWSVTSTAPDGTMQVATHVSGRLVTTASLAVDQQVIGSESYSYDVLNRPVASIDSRAGETVTSYLSDTDDRVGAITDPGKRTTGFAYDACGRQTSMTLPDGTVATTSYTSRGEVAARSGSQTYPVSYTYDYAGRRQTQTTNGSQRATTLWSYSPTRGFLTRKTHEDGKGTNYDYTAAGRLAGRTWARGVATVYAYDAGGRLTRATYSDDTPAVQVTYDAMGRQSRQTNGVANYTYHYSAATLQLVSETIAYDFNQDKLVDLTRTLDHSHDILQRTIGYTLKGAGEQPESISDAQIAYKYSSKTGFLEAVSNGSDLFTYSYAPGTSLLASVSGPVHTVENSWEGARDLLAIKTNSVANGVVSRYDYRVNPIEGDLAADALGQRIKVAASGQSFATHSTWVWTHDAFGQVVRADSNLDRFDRAYEFDAIGNRLKAVDSLTLPASDNYRPNALNQYISIPYGSAVVPPTYDVDGNMTSGPLPADPDRNSALRWDAENRLVEIQVGTGGPLVHCHYDSQGRRIAKTVGTATTLYVYDGWNVIAEYSPFNDQYSIAKSYTWGLDLSGSIHGAGGVGGLLSTTVGTSGSRVRYYPTYDGNGNVSEYLDATGAIVAHYEYDPFGRTVASSGAHADEFAHRFSTKLLDGETGLYHYGYRFYDPNTGRWPNRDLIEEEGGENTYQFSYNDSVDWVDVLGMVASHWQGIKPKSQRTKPTPIKDLPIPVRKAVGIPVSILSGDIFGPPLGEQRYEKGQCEFLVTINGIWNRKNDWENVRDWIRNTPTYRHIPTANYVPNPTSWIGDILAQIFGNEFLLAIDITPERAAKAIELAAAEAKKNKCCCWYVHVVGHSQGTMIANAAFDLLSKETREHVTFVGLGGERFVEDGKVGKKGKGGKRSVWNIAHVNDPVPWVLGNGKLNFTRNEAWHPPGHATVFGDAKNDRQGFKSHSFQYHYKDYMDSHIIDIPTCKNRKKK